MVTAVLKLKDTCSLEEKQPRQHIKRQRHYFANKGPSVKAMVFSVVMCGYESWTIKKAEHQELMLLNCGVGEDSWSLLACKEMKLVSPNGNQSWIFIGRTDAEDETPVLRPPDVKSWLIGKDPDAGGRLKAGGERMRQEDETVGWLHWLNGHEFEQVQEFGDGQGSLACCSPWGLRVVHD